MFKKKKRNKRNKDILTNDSFMEEIYKLNCFLFDFFFECFLSDLLDDDDEDDLCFVLGLDRECLPLLCLSLNNTH